MEPEELVKKNPLCKYLIDPKVFLNAIGVFTPSVYPVFVTAPDDYTCEGIYVTSGADKIIMHVVLEREVGVHGTGYNVKLEIGDFVLTVPFEGGDDV